MKKSLVIFIISIILFSIPFSIQAQARQCLLEEEWETKIAEKGIYLFGFAYSWQLREFYDVMSRVDAKDGLMVSFEPTMLVCPGNLVNALGCTYQNSRSSISHPYGVRFIRLSTLTPRWDWKRVVAHEYAHSLGIREETGAEAWAQDFLKKNKFE